jgi:polysaccharide biosynthesis transport protein
MIESEAPYIAFEERPGMSNADRFVQTQVELLRSPVVLLPVLSLPEIASLSELHDVIDPLEHLKKHLEVNQVGKSELYTVRYESPSAEDAATVANKVVHQYLEIHGRENDERTRFVIDVLEKERKARGTKVEQLRKRVVELAKEVTGTDPFNLGTVTNVDRALSPISSVHQSLTEADVNVEVLKAEIQALRDAPIAAPDQATSAGLLDLEVSNRADVRQLESRISTIGEKIADLQNESRKKIGDTWKSDPAYARLEQQSTQAKAELAELQASARKELSNVRAQQQQEGRGQLIATKTQELISLNKKRTLLAEKFEKELQSLRSGGAQSVELEFSKTELEREEKVFELIAARMLALQTESHAPTRVSLKQVAGVPALAIDPIPYKPLFLACLLSLVGPLALVVAKESLVRRISNAEQLAQESLLPVLGEVARFPVRHVAGKRQSLPPRQQREMYVFAESIDSLRTNLMLTESLGVNGQRKVIAICSAASGEGKTSVAAYLAASIAEATKQKTLILDADLRSPDIAEFFNVATHPGVAEVLDGKASLKDAVHRVGNSHTYVLPAGKHQVNPHHILHGETIDKLLATLRQSFSTIVIDTPPILGASESLVYAKAADLVVFCSLADVSRVKQVHVAIDRLQTTGARLKGAVLSGVPVNRYVYSYGSYTHAPAK